MILQEIIEIKYGARNNVDFVLGQDINNDYEFGILQWNLPDPQPTVAELWEWAEANKTLMLAPWRNDLRQLAEGTFYRLASEKSGEPINALIIQEWKDKEILALQWEADGKPNPPDPVAYELAYIEASGDPEKDAWAMMDAWLANAKPWRLMYNGFVAWRQGFTARLKAAMTEADLEALRDGMEAELRGMLGV